MTKIQIIEWFKNLSDYLICVTYLGEYDDTIDYAGPAGNKLLSKLIPRTLWGIDCNLAFYHHDGLYEKGGDSKARFEADSKMLVTALFIIEHTRNRWYLTGFNGARKHLARIRLVKYWEAVRGGGGKHFNFTESPV